MAHESSMKAAVFKKNLLLVPSMTILLLLMRLQTIPQTAR